MYPLLQNKFNLNKSEPFNIDTARYIVDEIHSNLNERRYMNYTLNETELDLLNKFRYDDIYLYAFGNDTVVQLANNDLFKFIRKTLDQVGNASIGHSDSHNQYLLTQKYYYAQIHPQHLVAIILGLQLEPQFKASLPKHSSSLLIELYQRDFTLPDDGSDPVYSRTNYYVKLYLDDVPVRPNHTVCDADFKCSWDSLYEFMKSR